MLARTLLCAALAATGAAAETLVLKNFTLIDGNGGPPVSQAAIVVEDGRIQWVGTAARLKTPAGADVRDLAGAYVMPGIINTHGHIGNVIDLTQDAKFYTRENVEKNLKTYASYGVTTVASMGTDQDLVFQIRDEQRHSRPTMTRVFTAGQGFTFQGGVGAMPGVTFNVDSPDEIPKDIDQLAAKKVDYVKMWVDDSLGHAKHMPFEIAKAVIDNAHRHKLRVFAHIFYLADAQQLSDAGINAFVHSVRDKPVDQALIASMKAHHVWQGAATLTREASMFVYATTPSFADDPFFKRGVSDKVVATLKDPVYQKRMRASPDFSRYEGFLKQAQENLKRLADAGIPYAMGTDSGPPGRFPGFFEQWEMQLMAVAGLTRSEVITASTKRGAEFLGAKDLGTLEKGKWADLIVLEKNPLEDIQNTRTIRDVYIAGNKVN
ncbi:MAG TPA: amidohydrolase family protein [Bryobacteraceae bacterium]|nr:amidohydrolase family protein [Bryobacteraceae bacterium]